MNLIYAESGTALADTAGAERAAAAEKRKAGAAAAEWAGSLSDYEI